MTAYIPVQKGNFKPSKAWWTTWSTPPADLHNWHDHLKSFWEMTYHGAGKHGELHLMVKLHYLMLGISLHKYILLSLFNYYQNTGLQLRKQLKLHGGSSLSVRTYNTEE